MLGNTLADEREQPNYLTGRATNLTVGESKQWTGAPARAILNTKRRLPTNQTFASSKGTIR